MSERLEFEPGLAVAAAGPASSQVETAAAARAGRFGWVLTLDAWLLLEARRLHGPWRTKLALALTRLGDARSWTVLAIALLATCTRTGIALGLRLGLGALLAALLSQALKRCLNRPRPTRAIEGFTALAENPDAFSFPSGHTSAAFAVAVAFGGAPFGLGPVSLVLAMGIALSRVYLGAHYPLDVAAGVALGSLAGAAVRLLVP